MAPSQNKDRILLRILRLDILNQLEDKIVSSRNNTPQFERFLLLRGQKVDEFVYWRPPGFNETRERDETRSNCQRLKAHPKGQVISDHPIAKIMANWR